MKKSLLTFVTILLVGFGNTYASNNSTINNFNNRQGNAFTFVESGITFSVFQNGEFDFYLNQHHNFSANYYNNGVNISFNAGYNYDAYVQYDRFGAVIQIENTPIYYDYYGRISQVGTININYSNGRLVRLGGMNVYYNNYGNYAYYRGYVNRYNRNYAYHPYHNYLVRPYYDYRVVSYKPYRNHYKAQRYAYHRDHAKNKYYSKNNNSKKRGNNTKYNEHKSHTNRQRVATNSIPKRRDHSVVNNSRNQVKATDLFKNERGNYNRTTTNSNRKTSSVQHRNTEHIATERSNSNHNINKRKPSSVHKKYAETRSSSANTKNRKGNTSNRKESTMNSRSKKEYTRKPVSTKTAKRTVTSRRTL